MVSRLISSVTHRKWAAIAFICVVLVVVGVSIYPAVLTRVGRHGVQSSGDETQLEDGTEPGESREGPEQGVILEETKITVPEPGGEPGWSFAAKRIEYDSSGNTARLVQAEGVRFSGSKPEAEIQAGFINIDFQSGKVDFGDYVTVKSNRGMSFTAKDVTWNPDTKKFCAYGNVQYKNGLSEISGDELEIDVGLEQARVTGNARFLSPALHGP